MYFADGIETICWCCQNNSRTTKKCVWQVQTYCKERKIWMTSAWYIEMFLDNRDYISSLIILPKKAVWNLTSMVLLIVVVGNKKAVSYWSLTHTTILPQLLLHWQKNYRNCSHTGTPKKTEESEPILNCAYTSFNHHFLLPISAFLYKVPNPNLRKVN